MYDTWYLQEKDPSMCGVRFLTKPERGEVTQENRGELRASSNLGELRASNNQGELRASSNLGEL